MFFGQNQRLRADFRSLKSAEFMPAHSLVHRRAGEAERSAAFFRRGIKGRTATRR